MAFKVIRNIFLVLLLVLFAWLISIFIDKPNVNNIITEADSEISYRKNYKELTEQDSKQNNTFLLEKAVTCKLYRNFFPYVTEEFNYNRTTQILKILNDSSSYRWGEIGTPEYNITVVFYDINGDKVGYTNIDLGGEADSKPYRSLMKWGMMTNSSFGHLSRILSIIPESQAKEYPSR